MWSTVFLHEFPDAEIRNFQAVPGALAADSLALTPIHIPGSTFNGLRINPGRGLGYNLETAFEGVIGFSCTMRIRFPPQGVILTAPLLSLGNIIRLTLETLSPIGSALLIDGKVRLRV